MTSSVDHGVTSTQHIKLVCESLINSRNYERLDRFIWALPVNKEYENIEIIALAKAYTSYRAHDFEKLYAILQQRNYSRRYHRQLQMLWRSAHYIEAEQHKGRPLGAVGKYRVRRKNPLPKTIWDGENMSYCFPKEARKLLNEAYQKTPYPTSKDKYILAESAYLTVTQVSNWFKNKRQRARATDSKDTSMEKSKQEECKNIGPDVPTTKVNSEEPVESLHYPSYHHRRYIYRSHPLIQYNNSPRDIRKPIQPTFYRLNGCTVYQQKASSFLRSYQSTYGQYNRTRQPCTCHVRNQYEETKQTSLM